ncbi:hypothetical protein ABTN00_19845, partial [Acinetobacter baumannii]
GEDIQWAAHKIQSVSIQGNGTWQKQTLSLVVKQALANFKMTLVGGFDHKVWKGFFQEWVLTPQKMPAWQLRKPVNFTAGADQLMMSQPMCLAAA